MGIVEGAGTRGRKGERRKGVGVDGHKHNKEPPANERKGKERKMTDDLEKGREEGRGKGRGREREREREGEGEAIRAREGAP